jgi:hypothetical protein
MPDSHARMKRIGKRGLGADDGFEPRDPHLGNGMAEPHASPPISPVAPETHVVGALCRIRLTRLLESTQFFVGAFPSRPTYPPEARRPPNAQRLGRACPQREARFFPRFSGRLTRLDSMKGAEGPQ